MQIPIRGKWCISIVLNKGKYSSCYNPHILLCKRGVCGYGLRFPPEWRIWNIDLDRKSRARNRRDRHARAALKKKRINIVRLFKLGWGNMHLASAYLRPNGNVSLYYTMPFGKTQGVGLKSPRLARLYFGSHSTT